MYGFLYLTLLSDIYDDKIFSSLVKNKIVVELINQNFIYNQNDPSHILLVKLLVNENTVDAFEKKIYKILCDNDIKMYSAIFWCGNRILNRTANFILQKPIKQIKKEVPYLKLMDKKDKENDDTTTV